MLCRVHARLHVRSHRWLFVQFTQRQSTIRNKSLICWPYLAGILRVWLPRGDDHFPFSGTNTFTDSSVSTCSFITAANSAAPPNLLWFTPTDSHNMHDVSVSTGDSYLQSFLVASGSIASPASGSLLASNVFTNPNYHTLLYLWWDECGGSNGSCDANNASPNLLYGTTVKKGYVSPDTTGIDEYAAVRTIENNWGFSPLAQGDTAAANAGYT